MRKQNYIAEIESNVEGIPCLIGIIGYDGSIGEDSGYSEWDVLDRKGYGAAWLARKLDANDRARIEDQITNYFN